MDQTIGKTQQRYTLIAGFILSGLYALFVLVPVSWLLYRVIVSTLDVPMAHDSPIMFYMSFIMDRFDKIPYRDFFDMNMLGSYLSYMWIGKIFGYTDWGIRKADLFLMGFHGLLIAAITWRFGWRTFLLAPPLYALRYMGYGTFFYMQREFVGLTPILAAIAVAVLPVTVSAAWRSLMAGFFFGIAATFKPHLAIGAPFVILYLVFEAMDTTERSFLEKVKFASRVIAISLCGFAVPLLAMIGYLAYHGALLQYYDLVINYLPLYGSMTADHRILSPAGFLNYRFNNLFRIPAYGMWVAVAAVSFYAALGNTALPAHTRKLAGMFMGLVLAYVIYPFVSGQYWGYHYFPLSVFLVIGLAVAFQRFGDSTGIVQRMIPKGLAAFVLISHFSVYELLSNRDFNVIVNRYQAEYVNLPKGGRPDRIAAFLKENMNPGDRVQPMDWARTGVMHGLLLAGAEPATRFVYDFHFYHHVNTPYIKGLRQEFLESLDRVKPRFIVEGTEQQRYFKGMGVSGQFPEYTKYRDENYVSASSGGGYVIWERKGSAAPVEPPRKRRKGAARPIVPESASLEPASTIHSEL